MAPIRFVIQRIAEFGVMVMHVDLAFGQSVLERRHEIDTVTEAAGLRLANPLHKGVEHVVLIGQVMRFEEGHIRRSFRHAIDVVVDAADELAGEEDTTPSGGLRSKLRGSQNR